VVASAVLFVALVASTIRFLTADYFPSRHVDASRSTLVARPEGGTRLTLVVLRVPKDGKLQHVVRPPEGDAGWRVELDGDAAREGEERTLTIDLPSIDQVTVLDRRWGGVEGLLIRGVRHGSSNPPTSEKPR
jgi:hypothetical protein